MLKQILSDKKTSYLIILLAIVARIIHLIFFFNIRVDGMYQVLATQNFVHGHGISSSFVLPSDLSTIIYEPQINWPPGYSLLLSPFYLLFNHHFIFAGIALEITAAIVFIFVTRSILSLLQTPLYLVNIFTLLSAFFLYPFYVICSSDASAITFLLSGIYFCLKIINTQQKSFYLTIGAAICLFLAGFIKYLFIPVVFIVPVLMYLQANADKRKPLLNKSYFIFLFLLLTIGGLLVWQKYFSGSATYISSTTRGFFPENLKGSYPAGIASFINPDTVSMALPGGLRTDLIIFRIFQFIHILLLSAILFFAFRFYRKKGMAGLSLQGSFLNYSFWLSLAIIILLSALSLYVGKEENIPGHWWSYVDEARYYGLPMVLIQLSFFLIITLKNEKFRSLLLVLFVLFCIESVRGLIFTIKRIQHAGNETYSWQYDKEIQDYVNAVIKNKLQKNPGTTGVVTGSTYYINYRVGMNSHLPILIDIDPLLSNTPFQTKKPVMVFAITNANDALDRQLSKQNNWELSGIYDDFNIYTSRINSD